MPSEVEKLKKEIERLQYESEARRQALAGSNQDRDELKRQVERARKDRWDDVERYEGTIEALQAERDHHRDRADRNWDELQKVQLDLEVFMKRFEFTANKMADLEARTYHIKSVLNESFTVPQIDEIRKVRGLEPLSKDSSQ